MSKKLSRVIPAAVFTFMVFITGAPPANAALVYDWYITDTEQTVSPDEVFTINATIVNDATSTENFDLDAAITTAVVSSFPSPYDAVFGPGDMNILAQFNGVVLAPGESFDFVFATLTPDPAPVPEGIYSMFGPGLVINGSTDYWEVENPTCILYPQIPNCDLYITGSVLITVADVSAVPLPAAAWLFGSGLLGLVAATVRRRASSA